MPTLTWGCLLQEELLCLLFRLLGSSHGPGSIPLVLFFPTTSLLSVTVYILYLGFSVSSSSLVDSYNQLVPRYFDLTILWVLQIQCMQKKIHCLKKIQTLVTSILFSVSLNLPIFDTSCEWNHIIYACYLYIYICTCM